MPPHQEQSMSYTTLRLRDSVQGKPYSSLWDFILDIYTLGKKMDFHKNTYLLLLFKRSIKNEQSIFNSKL